jgi:predicted hydrocarbon binding protein
MRDYSAQHLTEADHEKAFIEVAFLTEIFGGTIDNIMGGTTSSVGRISGREFAKKLRFTEQPNNHQEFFAALQKRMAGGFEFSYDGQDGAGELTFQRCVIADICKTRSMKTGGPLCTLFHSYFDGIVNELTNKPTKTEITSSELPCKMILKTQ